MILNKKKPHLSSSFEAREERLEEGWGQGRPDLALVHGFMSPWLRADTELGVGGIGGVMPGCEGLDFRPFSSRTTKKQPQCKSHLPERGPALSNQAFNFLFEDSLTCTISSIFCHSGRQQ